MRMVNKKNRRGFTVAELMLVVAIVAIVAAFGFIAAYNYQKRLEISELDNTAKQIFVAAQNHYTTAFVSGNWDRFVAEQTDKSVFGTKFAEAPDDADSNFDVDNTYYISSKDAGADVIFEYLLPYLSIDETLREGTSSFVVEYNIANGTIYGVWYTNDGTAAAVEGGRSSRDVRMNNDPMMGYYGGATAETASTADASSNNMKVVIKNGEELVLYIYDYNEYEGTDGISKVTVTGATSGQEGTIDLTAATVTETSEYKLYTVILDSVTTQGKHFAQQFTNLKAGEDITVTVTVTKDGRDMTKSATDNSIFEYINGTTASVANGRHLQNLSTAVSGAAYITEAVQSQEIDWSTFIENKTLYDVDGNDVGTKFVSIYNKYLELYNGNHLAISNLAMQPDLNGNMGLIGTTATGSFTLKNAKLENPTVSGSETGSSGALIGLVDGGNAKVDNCKVYFTSAGTVYGKDAAGIAIGKVSSTSAVTIDIDTVEITGSAAVTVSSKGAAGGLIGDVSMESGTLNIDDTIISGSSTEDSITGGTHAGGIVGSLTAKTVNIGTTRVTFYIVAEGGAAGGFIGYLDKATDCSITESFVGGRTTYEDGATEETPAASSYLDSTDSTKQGRYNVISKSASYGAGGFIGTITSSATATITDSYTTASAYNTNGGSAGGFAGTVASATTSVSDCYSTGLVGSTTVANAGCFIGLDSGVTASGNYYLTGINKTVSGVSGSNSSKTTSATGAAPATAGSPFANTTSVNASPVNEMLKSKKYTYTSAAGLTHIGDWPYAGAGTDIRVVIKWADRYYDADGGKNDTYTDEEWDLDDYISVTAVLYSYTTDPKNPTEVARHKFEGSTEEDWTYEWTNLPEQDSAGNDITYYVRELYEKAVKDENDSTYTRYYLNDPDVDVKSYFISYAGPTAAEDDEEVSVYTISNVHEYVRIYGEITWIDLDSNKRPDMVNLYLIKGDSSKTKYISNTKMQTSATTKAVYDVDKKTYTTEKGEWEFDYGYWLMRADDATLNTYTVRQKEIQYEGDIWYTNYSESEDNRYHIEICNQVCYYVYYYTDDTSSASVISTQEYTLVEDSTSASGYTWDIINTKGVTYDVQVNGMSIVGWYKAGEDIASEDTLVYPYNQSIQTTSSNVSDYYVNDDMNLVPEYAYSCTLSFNTMIDGVYVDSQVYAVNDKTVAPSDPSYEGYTFDGWYTSNAYTTKYEFGQTIVEDTVLYAKWIADKDASFTVIIWKQSENDWYNTQEKTYDYYKSYYFEEAVAPFYDIDTYINDGYLDSYMSLGETDLTKYQENEFAGFYCSGRKCANDDTYFAADNSTVINIYYDRAYFNIVFKNWRGNTDLNSYQGEYMTSYTEGSIVTIDKEGAQVKITSNSETYSGKIIEKEETGYGWWGGTYTYYEYYLKVSDTVSFKLSKYDDYWGYYVGSTFYYLYSNSSLSRKVEYNWREDNGGLSTTATYYLKIQGSTYYAEYKDTQYEITSTSGNGAYAIGLGLIYTNKDCDDALKYYNLSTTSSGYVLVKSDEVTYKVEFGGTEYDITNVDGKSYVSALGKYLLTVPSHDNLLYDEIPSYSGAKVCYEVQTKVSTSDTTYYGLVYQAFDIYKYTDDDGNEIQMYYWPVIDGKAWKMSSSSGTTLTTLYKFFQDDESTYVSETHTYTLTLFNASYTTQYTLALCKEDITQTSDDGSVVYTVANERGLGSLSFTFSQKYLGYTLAQFSLDGETWYDVGTNAMAVKNSNGYIYYGPSGFSTSSRSATRLSSPTFSEWKSNGATLYVGYTRNIHTLQYYSNLNGRSDVDLETEIYYDMPLTSCTQELVVGGYSIEEYVEVNGLTSKTFSSASQTGFYLNAAKTIAAADVLEEIYLAGGTFTSATQYSEGGSIFLTAVSYTDADGNAATMYIDADGRYFKGWYKDPSGVDKVDFTINMPDANYLAYGIWDMPTVEISFESVSVDENDTFTLDAKTYKTQTIHINNTSELTQPDSPARENYLFMGWYVKDEDGNYTIANFGAKYTKDTVIYARWLSLEDYYHVYYIVDGSASVVKDNNSYVNGAKVRVKSYDTDDDFIGWNTKEDGTGVAYYPGLTYTIEDSDLMLYAQYAVDD